VKTLIILTFILILNVQLNGQVKEMDKIHPDSNSISQKNPANNNRYLQVKFEHGGILPIDDDPKVNQLLKNSNFSGISMRYGWELNPSSVYNQLYRGPVLGLGFLVSTFRNPVIGSPMSLFSFVEIPFSRNTSRWNFTYGMSFGLSFHFNPYDYQKNPDNLMIGSKFNAYLHFNVEGRYMIDKNWQLGLGIGFKHFSNGATKKPNAGINLAPIQLSVQYKINKNSVTPIMNKLPSFKPFFSFAINTASGLKQNNPGEELIYKNQFGIYEGYQFSYKYKLGIGFDFTYSSGGTNRVPGNESAFSKNFSYSVYTGWEWYITDRLYMPLYLGFYLHRNYENSESEKIYERIGLRYLFFNRHLTIGPGLKAHAGTADFVEFNIGWIFHHDKNHYSRN
jgi:Lipid A 3-O-deacylase (PagL)